MKIYVLLLTTACLALVGCLDTNPNMNASGQDVIQTHLGYTDVSTQQYQDTVYIPTYSNIYSEHRGKTMLLTSTLSIRNTSLKDTTYINSIEYYNTEGQLVRSYIDQTLILGPMQSIDYVIDREDDTGGTGANFLVTWGADKDTKPLFQAIMISTFGPHGLSFVTNGVSTKTNK